MDSRHPLEIVCSHVDESSQLIFALRAIELLPARIDCSLAASKEGLIMRAETEAALGRHLDLLRSLYGGQLRVGPLRVLYRDGPTVEEPFMAVRVRCNPGCFEAVKNDLLTRGAMVVDEELSQARGVLRVVAPLAQLLGYSQHLRALTAGEALEVMWFSHYAPVRTSRLEYEQRSRPDDSQRTVGYSCENS